MSFRAWLVGRGARVAPLEAMNVQQHRQPLEALAESVADRKKRAALRAVADAAQALEETAAAALEAATTFTFKFSDIVSSRGSAFLDSELQWYFRRWKRQRMEGSALADELDDWVRARPGAPPKPTLDPASPTYARELEKWNDDVLEWAITNDVDDVVPGSPLEYASRQRSGSPDAKLQLYLGGGYLQRLPGKATKAPPSLQDGSRWPWLAGRLWPPGDAASMRVVRSMLDPADPQSVARLRSKIDLVMQKTRAEFTQAEVDDAVRVIQNLTKRYLENGELTEAAVRRLAGNKDLTSEDFVDRVLSGISMMRDEADLLGPNLFDDLLDIPGIESFIESVVHRSGFEHGYRFEVFLAVRDLFQGVSKNDLWMQVFVNGKMGPDIVKVIRDDGPLRGRIVQAKSYKSLSALLGAGETGEIRRQLLSDLKRIKDDGFQITGPDGVKIPVDERIDFKLDFFRVRLTSFEIDGIDPSDLRAAPNTAAAQRAREAFYNQHMKPRIDEINDWMRSPEFRTELGLGPNDPLPNFTLDVELADQVILPELIP